MAMIDVKKRAVFFGLFVLECLYPLLAQGVEVVFPVSPISMDEAFKLIEEQTPYTLSFNYQDVDLAQMVTVPAKQKISVDNALHTMFDKAGYRYDLFRNCILIFNGSGQLANTAESCQEENFETVLFEPLALKPNPLQIGITQTRYNLIILRKRHEDKTTDKNQGKGYGAGGLTSSPHHPSPEAVPWYAKVNLLYAGASLTPNLGLEVGLSKHTTLDASVGYHPWNRTTSNPANRKFTHLTARAEYRYWLTQRFNGHFFGAHLLFTAFNISNHKLPLFDFEKGYRYQGTGYGAGLSYGYLWKWNYRWGMEFTLGAGAVWRKYDVHDCVHCGERLEQKKDVYLGPTQAGITLVYQLTGKPKAALPKSVVTPPAEVLPLLPVERVVTVKPDSTPRLQPEVSPPTPARSAGDSLAAILTFVEKLPADYRIPRTQQEMEERAKGTPDESLMLYFPQGSNDLDLSFHNNRESMDKLMTVIRRIADDKTCKVAYVLLGGYASPEGSSTVNRALAGQRVKQLKRYVVQNSTLADSLVIDYNGGVNWQYLRQLVEASDLPEKREITEIIDHIPVWDAQRGVGRLGQLMRLHGGNTYRKLLKEFFPAMRNVAYIKVFYTETK
ncbi:MAG: DUF3575 domain-containing protein [Mediterranea sp.]|nr:DUF3575 domain-containing protein [Mediterranea sp.]